MKSKLIKICFVLLSLVAFAPGVHAYSGPDVELSLPIYGNWCGPGHGGRSYNNPYPVDVLDTGCMNHDLCYIQNGYFNSACDKTLLQYIKDNKYQMKGVEKDYANLVYATFALAKLRP